MFEQKTVHIQKQKMPFDILRPLVSVVDFQFTNKKHKLCRGPLPSMVPIGQVTDILECEVMTIRHMIICKGDNQWSFMHSLILLI